jgi:hypothetical protein
MNKRYLHFLWARIKPVKTIYLVLACLAAGGGAAIALRDNYTTMTSLRTQVYQADEAGVGVEESLQKLRAYVGSHMNTDLAGQDGVYPPIQLKYTYARLQQAERDRADAESSKIYTDAQAECERRFPGSFSGGPRVPCIEQYVKDHGTAVRPIPEAMYKFSFTSPSWSPDLAGWLVAASAVLGVAAALRFALGMLMKRVL